MRLSAFHAHLRPCLSSQVLCRKAAPEQPCILREIAMAASRDHHHANGTSTRSLWEGKCWCQDRGWMMHVQDPAEKSAGIWCQLSSSFNERLLRDMAHKKSQAPWGLPCHSARPSHTLVAQAHRDLCTSLSGIDLKNKGSRENRISIHPKPLKQYMALAGLKLHPKMCGANKGRTGNN